MTSTTTAASPPPSTTPRRRGTLVGFLLLIFAAATAEYLVAGLLPQLATDLHVTVATAGQTATAYALGVAVGGPIVTVATARVPRKGLTLALVAVFVFGTALSGLADSFALLITGRVVAACAQAPLFAIALLVATESAEPGREGRAIATVTSGLTVATVAGVPIGASLGGQWGWRFPFLVIAALAAAGAAVLTVTMPRSTAAATDARTEIRTLLRRPVLLAIATTAIGFAGVSTVYTYLVPLLTHVTGFRAGTVVGLLFAYGAGGFAGNLLAGRLTDRNPRATLRAVLAVLTVVLAVQPAAAGAPVTAVLAVLALGLLSTATIAPLQHLILGHARQAPTLAVAVNIGAFNLANALGAGLGGAMVAAGALRMGGLFGAVLALFGLAVAIVADSRYLPHDGTSR